MTLSARDYAERLQWAWIPQRQEYGGLCPLHESSGTHAVNAGVKDSPDGTVLFHCFAGCQAVEFFRLMNGANQEQRAPSPRHTPKTVAREVCRYPYTDEQGTLLYWNIRYEPKDFRMARPGPDGAPIWEVKSLTRRVWYNLPALLESEHPVFIVEGEKDADTLIALGLTATCIAGGAAGWEKYAQDYLPHLTGRDLILIPDNDEPGRQLMEHIATASLRIAKRCRTLALPGVPPHGDVTDWVAAGGTATQLWDLAQASLTDTAIVEMSAEDLLALNFPPLRWFASGLLHEGMVLFGGKSKRGKSSMMLNMAVALASGQSVFGQFEVSEPRKVLYCALEDGPRRVQRRLRQLFPPGQPIPSGLLVGFRMPPLEEGGIQYIADKITEGYQVIVIDVLAHVEKSGKHGLRDYHEVYSQFAPLQTLRSKFAFALIMITHLRKMESEDVFADLHGSVAYQGVQDALWVMARKAGENEALLHVRDKDIEDKVVELRFDGSGCWSFVGEGDEHTSNRQEDQIIRLLREERRPQTLRDILNALGLPQTAYASLRVRMHRMASKGLVLRTDRGMYSATYPGDDDPF